ncbi:MAG: exodeoxyribonuclease VII small subunit [Firmicutes bacterium]|nr:exodeoxyribonuclease VII small subunit [Bacillota bacterium]
MAKTEEKELSFEESLEKLETIVKELENGNAKLDEAIEKYTEAMNLASNCSKKLENATETVNKILKDNGSLEDFNIEE